MMKFIMPELAPSSLYLNLGIKLRDEGFLQNVTSHMEEGNWS